MQSGYQAAAVDNWDGLHFLPLIMTVFLSHHEKEFICEPAEQWCVWI